MKDVTKIKLAGVLVSARFWVATLILYLLEQGLSIEEAFQLLSIFYSIGTK